MATDPKPYGNVKYADPKGGKYPIDTEEHVRAAWAYIHQKKNQSEYNASQLKTVIANIRAAAKKFNIKLEA